MSQPASCRICGNVTGNQVHGAREMMFGSREPFPYVECVACGTVQLAEQPPDMSRFYPDAYYSGGDAERTLSDTARRRRRMRTELALRLPRSLAALPKLDPGPKARWFRGHATTRSRIVDFGCGAGRNLHVLWNAGFEHLVGFDPYFTAGGSAPFVVHQVVPDWFSGHFDVAMMHHAFEHVPDPRAQLELLKSVLAPGGKILLRVPLADSWAWQHYGVDWVQLDPPRHFWLFTDRAIDRLAAGAGLQVVDRWRDSTAFQFWGSDLYAAGMPLHGSGPPPDSAELAVRADALNRSGRGDQGVFWLSASPGPSAGGHGG